MTFLYNFERINLMAQRAMKSEESQAKKIFMSVNRTDSGTPVWLVQQFEYFYFCCLDFFNSSFSLRHILHHWFDAVVTFH